MEDGSALSFPARLQSLWGPHPEHGSGYYALERFHNTPKPASQLSVARFFSPLKLAPELSNPCY